MSVVEQSGAGGLTARQAGPRLGRLPPPLVALAVLRGLAGLARRAADLQEGLRQRDLQRRHAGRPLFPGRQRLHAGLRPDAQRQPRAWLALSARRLYRLRGRATRPASGCSASPPASSRSPSSALLMQVFVFRRMEGDELRQTLVTIGISIVAADLMLAIWTGETYQFGVAGLARRRDRRCRSSPRCAPTAPP